MKNEKKCKEISQTLAKLKEVILDHWENQVRKNISDTFHADHILLKDHFSELLDQLIVSLERNELSEIDYARAHGFQRAIMTNYSFPDVLREYSILRMCLIDYLYPMGDIECSKFVHAFLDKAALYSISEFLRDITFKKQFEKLPIEGPAMDLH